MKDNRGRKKGVVRPGFFQGIPTYPMQLLIEMKNSGMSWREIGTKLGVSGALAWKVTKGICKSNKIETALGLAEPIVEVPKAMAKKHYPNPQDKDRNRVALEFENKQDQQEMIDILAMYGKTRKEQSAYLKKLLAGLFPDRAALYDAMLAELDTSTSDILNGVLDRWLEYQEL